MDTHKCKLCSSSARLGFILTLPCSRTSAFCISYVTSVDEHRPPGLLTRLAGTRRRLRAGTLRAEGGSEDSRTAEESNSKVDGSSHSSGSVHGYGEPVPSKPTRPFDASVVHPSWYINMRPDNPCVVCLGEGYIRCMHCYGAGYVVVGPEPEDFPERDREVCTVCYGEGRHQCRRCEGTGKRPMWIIDPATRERRSISLERDLPWKKALMDLAETELRRQESEKSKDA
jgi:hypothetical protein